MSVTLRSAFDGREGSPPVLGELVTARVEIEHCAIEGNAHVFFDAANEFFDGFLLALLLHVTGAAAGFRRLVVPRASLEQMDGKAEAEVTGVESVEDAWEVLGGR